MWHKIKTTLEAYPERLKVARVLIENGLSTKKRPKIYLNKIEIPPNSNRSCRGGVDRRTVNETLVVYMKLRTI